MALNLYQGPGHFLGTKPVTFLGAGYFLGSKPGPGYFLGTHLSNFYPACFQRFQGSKRFCGEQSLHLTIYRTQVCSPCWCTETYRRRIKLYLSKLLLESPDSRLVASTCILCLLGLLLGSQSCLVVH